MRSITNHVQIVTNLVYLILWHTVNRIGIVKPEKKRMVEELLVRMARTGQLRPPVNEQYIIDLLGELAQAGESNGGADAMSGGDAAAATDALKGVLGARARGIGGGVVVRYIICWF